MAGMAARPYAYANTHRRSLVDLLAPNRMEILALYLDDGTAAMPLGGFEWLEDPFSC